MGALDFYNQNAVIAYPLAELAQPCRLGGRDWRPDILLDCGFTVERPPAAARLARIRRVGRDIVYGFRLGELWCEVPASLDDPPETVSEARGPDWDAYLVAGPGQQAFAAWPDGGVQHLLPELDVEPARVAWLHAAWVTELRLMNRREGRDAILEAAGLVGEVTFRAGVNAQVAVRARDNALEISSDLGGGASGGFPACSGGEVAVESCAGFVRTLNGIGPDASGNFQLKGGPGVKVWEERALHKVIVDFEQGMTDQNCETK